MAFENSSTTHNSETTTVTSSYHPQAFNTPISHKLTTENYRVATSACQLATIRGLQLFKFLDGQDTPPKYLNLDNALLSIV